MHFPYVSALCAKGGHCHLYTRTRSILHGVCLPAGIPGLLACLSDLSPAARKWDLSLAQGVGAWAFGAGRSESSLLKVLRALLRFPIYAPAELQAGLSLQCRELEGWVCSVAQLEQRTGGLHLQPSLHKGRPEAGPTDFSLKGQSIIKCHPPSSRIINTDK